MSTRAGRNGSGKVFVLPDNPQIRALWETELTAPNAGANLANMFVFGKRAFRDQRREAAQKKNRGTSGPRVYFDPARGTHVHEFPPSATYDVLRIDNQTFGVVASVPKQENLRHGGWFGDFVKKVNLLEGEPFLYIHVPLHDVRLWPSIPGETTNPRNNF